LKLIPSMRLIVLCFVLVGAGCGHQCVDNLACVQGAHWDSDQCTCVFADGGVPDLSVADLSASDLGGCMSGCGGGGTGCPNQCTGCTAGQLCCAWAGGACIPDPDLGTCSGNGGYSCATPTAAGVCPNQCYP
jgi:hypothetical protein